MEAIGSKRVLIPAVGGVFAAPVGLAWIIGEEAFLQGVAVVVFALGVAFAISYINHLVVWRLRREPDPDVHPRVLQCLDRLLALQFPLVVLWLLAAVALLVHPLSTVPVLPLEVPWVAVLLLVLSPWVMVALSATSRLADRAGLPFVTEVVRGSRLAGILGDLIDPFERVLFLVPLREWLRRTETPGLVSGFSVLLLSSLIFLAVETTYGVAAHRMIDLAVDEIVQEGDEQERVESGPTFEELCPGQDPPGAPAPHPWRQQLYALWLGNESIEGAGAIEAGCTEPAREANGRPGLWLVEGACGSSLRALGLVARGRTPSLLYQQAAQFALAQEHAGTLRGASPRIDVGDGDLYLIDTAIGTYLLIRARKASGIVAPNRVPRRCEDYTSDNYPYLRTPPGLVRLWLQMARKEWVWPELDIGSDPSGHRFAFLGNSGGGVVAHAYCSTDTHCVMEVNGTERETPVSLRISLEDVLDAAADG